MYGNKAYSELITGLYQAATEPKQWESALKSVATLLDGHIAFIMPVGAGAHDGSDLHIHNLPVESFVAYGEHYYQHDLWSPPWLSRRLHALGSVYSGDQLVSRAVFKRSVWFNEFLRPLDIEHSIFASLSDGGDNPVILAIDRPLGADAFSDTDRENLRRAASHFARALALARHFSSLQLALTANDAALENLNYGVLACDLDGRLLHANALALHWLKYCGLSADHGVLQATTERQRRDLAQMFSLAKQGIGHSWSVNNPPPSRSFNLKSLPLERTEQAQCLSQRMENGKVLLLITEQSPQADPFQQFAEHYRLTRQEAKVLSGMISGLSAREIAEQNAVTYNTVRSQIASILQKTACKTQRQLLHLVLACGFKPD